MFEAYGVTVNTSEALIVEDNWYNENRRRKNYTAWLIIDNVNVGMMRYLIGGDEHPMICDIEIREEYRGAKLGAHLIRMVENELVHNTLHTTGNYTPEGYHALSALVPVSSYNGDDTPKLAHTSMNFVHNWDAFQLKGF